MVRALPETAPALQAPHRASTADKNVSIRCLHGDRRLMIAADPIWCVLRERAVAGCQAAASIRLPIAGRVRACFKSNAALLALPAVLLPRPASLSDHDAYASKFRQPAARRRHATCGCTASQNPQKMRTARNNNTRAGIPAAQHEIPNSASAAGQSGTFCSARTLQKNPLRLAKLAHRQPHC